MSARGTPIAIPLFQQKNWRARILYPGINDILSGCQIQIYRLETIANNLANADTAGFKKDVLSFDHMLKTHQEANMDQGNIKHTDNALDLALSGKGFFKVSTPGGFRYTRNGKFYVNAEGQLSTTAGDPVMGEGGPITIEGTDVAVDDSGGSRLTEKRWIRWLLCPLHHRIFLRSKGTRTTCTMVMTEKALGPRRRLSNRGTLSSPMWWLRRK